MVVVIGDDGGVLGVEEAWLERRRVVPLRVRTMSRMWVSFRWRLAMVKGFRRNLECEGRER